MSDESTASLDELRKREAVLRRELAETVQLLDAGAPTSDEPSLLDNMRIASPCAARWEDMIGDERSRHCHQCDKSVFNLSAMTRAEGEALLREKGTAACVRLYKRADGTVMTTDCPVGAKKKRVRLAVLTTIAGVGAGIAVALQAYEQQSVPVQTGCRARPMTENSGKELQTEGPDRPAPRPLMGAPMWRPPENAAKK